MHVIMSDNEYLLVVGKVWTPNPSIWSMWYCEICFGQYFSISRGSLLMFTFVLTFRRECTSQTNSSDHCSSSCYIIGAYSLPQMNGSSEICPSQSLYNTERHTMIPCLMHVKLKSNQPQKFLFEEYMALTLLYVHVLVRYAIFHSVGSDA